MSVVLNRTAKASQCFCIDVSAANAGPEHIPAPAKIPRSTTERTYFKRIGNSLSVVPTSKATQMTLCQQPQQINTVFQVCRVYEAAQRRQQHADHRNEGELEVVVKPNSFVVVKV
jgi:hypothetical protein